MSSASARSGTGPHRVAVHAPYRKRTVVRRYGPPPVAKDLAGPTPELHTERQRSIYAKRQGCTFPCATHPTQGTGSWPAGTCSCRTFGDARRPFLSYYHTAAPTTSPRRRRRHPTRCRSGCRPCCRRPAYRIHSQVAKRTVCAWHQQFQYAWAFGLAPVARRWLPQSTPPRRYVPKLDGTEQPRSWKIVAFKCASLRAFHRLSMCTANHA